jgi:tetratricopeptide (TPR) repeat protein
MRHDIAIRKETAIFFVAVAMILPRFVFAQTKVTQAQDPQTEDIQIEDTKAEDVEDIFEEQDLFTMLDDKTKKLYNDSIEALNRGEKTLAVMYMERALARIGQDDPRYKVVLKGVVTCYQQAALYHYNYDDKADAIYYFNKVISAIEKYKDKFFEEKSDESYAYLGKIYYDKGDKKRANSYLNILRRRNSAAAPYWRDQLVQYMKTKRPTAK